MEDASKEFQVFLSPRENAIPSKEIFNSRQRLVPVINKLFNSTTSAFTISQRKSSVYKAVSGVSFQETDTTNKPPKVRNDCKDNEKQRRKSYANSFAEDRILSDKSIGHGTRRSKSLTNVENINLMLSNTSKQSREIVHPFSPVILHNQSSGRKSRYSRIKERRRSSSQARPKNECIKYENGQLILDNTKPVAPPRRSRSASRPRPTFSLTTFEEKEYDSTTNTFKDKKEDTYSHKYESRYKKNPNGKISHSNNSYKAKYAGQPQESDTTISNSNWSRPDNRITKKAELSARKKEEAEGGYFSLEREELDFNGTITRDNNGIFERENSSETIYVAQGIHSDQKSNNSLARNDQYVVEEIYSEVPFSRSSTEIGYAEDEGLYEEIFFDQNEGNDIQTGEIKYQSLNTPINIPVFAETSLNYEGESTVSNNLESQLPITSPTSIVYINGDNKSESSGNYSSSTSTITPVGSSILTLLDNCSDEEKTESILQISTDPERTQMSLIKTSNVDIETKPPSWCGCSVNFSSKHSSACIQAVSSSVIPKRTFFSGKLLLPNIEGDEESAVKSKMIDKSTDKSTYKSIRMTSHTHRDSNNTCHDSELNDIDLDMFTPKIFNGKLSSKVNIRCRESSSFIYSRNIFSNRPNVCDNSHQTNLSNSKTVDYVSPKTLEDILQDSIFNPRADKSFVEAPEEIDLQPYQIIQSISDFSSSDESEEELYKETPLASPWLEAKDDFEYVKFTESLRETHKSHTREKFHEIMSSMTPRQSHLALNKMSISQGCNSRSKHKENENVPKRPSRRRRRKTTLDIPDLRTSNTKANFYFSTTREC